MMTISYSTESENTIAHLSPISDREFFDSIAHTIEQQFGGRWIEKVDGIDQRYWDLQISNVILTLHLEHFTGIYLIPAHNTTHLAEANSWVKMIGDFLKSLNERNLIDATRHNLQSWVDPRIEVRSSPIEGNGMFARERIDAGPVVIIWGGTIFTEEEIQAGKANPHSIAAIDEGVYLADPIDAPSSPDYFLNHSCNPNVWMKDEIILVARRTIEPGEELTADYAFWENDSAWVLEPCHCGTSLCRGRITGNDWQLPELQNRYGNHFTPFINKRIQKQKQP